MGSGSGRPTRVAAGVAVVDVKAALCEKSGQVLRLAIAALGREQAR